MRATYTKVLVGRARGLRKESTPAERKLWFEYLRGHPARPRRQCPIDGYIADFYVHAAKLVIELDGNVHDSPDAREYDIRRTRHLEALGLRVMRFSNAQVMHRFEAVRQALEPLLTDNKKPPL